MPRDVVSPTKNKYGDDEHPAWGRITVTRSQNGPPGATLFDSDIRHQHTVHVTLHHASRKRDLNRDRIHAGRTITELEFSEAQWASFVASVGSGSGTSCTILALPGDMMVPGMPFESRLQESAAEVKDAAKKALEAVEEAFAAVEEKPNKGNIRNLKYAIANLPSNLSFAAESLTEHTENVVQKARADIEAIVAQKAAQLGIEPSDLGDHALLMPGEED